MSAWITCFAIVILGVIILTWVSRLLSELSRKIHMLEGQQQALERTKQELELSKQDQAQRALDGERTKRVEAEAEVTKLQRDIENISSRLTGLTKEQADADQLSRRVEDVLKFFRTPQTAGVQFGETALELILQRTLGDGLFERKPRFLQSGNETVDFILKLPDCVVPIDSKFPAEAYREWVDGIEKRLPEQELKIRWRKFRDALMQKLEETSKYIRPADSTTEYALMFVPSDAIFQQAFGSERMYGEPNPILRRSHELRVFGCSPQTIMPILGLIRLGLQQLKITEEAKLVQQQVAELDTAFDKFAEDWSTLNKHVTNAFNVMASGKNYQRLDSTIKQLATFATSRPTVDSTNESRSPQTMVQIP